MSAGRPVRVLRVIARLNVGGPAIQAITLTARLAPRGYETLLIRGEEHPAEGSMDPLATDLGVRPRPCPGLGRELGPGDARALADLVGVIRRFRPDVVHTHAAKAGTLGRAAALLARSPAVLVHTFHGHVLRGYFSPRRSRAFLAVERALARRTDRLVAVSAEIRDDLVALGVAPASRFSVVPLGLDLARFALDPAARARARAAVRAELHLDPAAPVVALVARLVPIKRVDRFLRVAARVAADRPETRFVVVGDGELGTVLRSSPEAAALGDRLVWTGLRDDVPRVLAACDLVALTSDNEGTPVSLIEAQAAALPVVSTAVGGVGSAVAPGLSARLVPPEDEGGLAAAVTSLLDDPAARERLGAAGHEHSRGFGLPPLLDRIDALYAELLAERARAA